ncbi:MAG TPA: LysR family transcriptional regulator [Bacteriovoracaceae bacterium]|nr:LysR family transcriptional regulator [Bacteriovoracaceae bacterium]
MKEITLDYRYLKAFMVTSRYLNFSKAATELNIAQSAVSRQIKLLEESVGEQLIIRSSKKVLLTEKGQSLLEELGNFEGRLQEIFFGHMNKTIKVGILHGLLETWFNEVIIEFSKNNKHQLIVEINNLETLKEKLQNGKYDLIFTTENIQSELVSSLKLFEEKMVLVSKAEINPKEAYEYPWIVYSEHDHLFHLFKKRSSKTVVVNSITTILKLVRKGVGISIVPDHTIEPDMHLRTYDLKGLAKQYIHLSSLNYKMMPAHIKELVEIIKRRQS